MTRAIVRPPGRTFAGGLTTSASGAPSLELAREQHARYCDALRSCGLEIVELPPDDAHPDAPFVEDTAVIVDSRAIVTYPGVPSRTGEVGAVRDILSASFDALAAIEPPGTVDGGDVCEGADRFYIGLSQRTNAEGAEQLTTWLAGAGILAKTVDIRDVPGLLHLKSGMAYLGEGRYAVVDALRTRISIDNVIGVEPEEAYAANCVRVNDALLIASGFPIFERTMRDMGYETISLDVSEYAKMDGGLSCLSLRF